MNLQFGQDTMGTAHLCSRWHHVVLLEAGNDSVVGCWNHLKIHSLPGSWSVS